MLCVRKLSILQNSDDRTGTPHISDVESRRWSWSACFLDGERREFFPSPPRKDERVSTTWTVAEMGRPYVERNRAPDLWGSYVSGAEAIEPVGAAIAGPKGWRGPF